MPDEGSLRDELHRASAPNTLDSRRIIAKSRARRLPRQIAAGTLGALALAGITVLAVQVTQLGDPATTTAGAAFDESAPATSEFSGVKRAPADRINLCEAQLADVAQSHYGLELSVTFPETVPAGSNPISGTVRLTNTSDREVVGSTPASPALTLSQQGIVVWHTNGATEVAMVSVDLAPGASVEYSASFSPVRCGVDDDLTGAFGPDLPALEAGTYQLSALMDFTADPSMGQKTAELDLVSGPLATIQIG
ncbi:MAG: hypothetical protein KF761_01305 [Salinibacterium sp.]|nr:hypothetical protein [Salinibacterium sp.]